MEEPLSFSPDFINERPFECHHRLEHGPRRGSLEGRDSIEMRPEEETGHVSTAAADILGGSESSTGSHSEEGN